MRKGRETCID